MAVERKILSTWKIHCRLRGNRRRRNRKCQAMYTDNCPVTKSRNFFRPLNWSTHWKTHSSIGDFVVHDEYGAALAATAVVLVLAGRCWIDCSRPVPPCHLHPLRRPNLRPWNNSPPKTLWKSMWFRLSILLDWAELVFVGHTEFCCAPPTICETIASVLYQHNLSPKNLN